MQYVTSEPLAYICSSDCPRLPHTFQLGLHQGWNFAAHLLMKLCVYSCTSHYDAPYLLCVMCAGNRPGSAAAQAGSCSTSIMTTSTMRRLGLDSPGPSIAQASLAPPSQEAFQPVRAVPHDSCPATNHHGDAHDVDTTMQFCAVVVSCADGSFCRNRREE